jgi:hypothetical protein
MGPLQALLIARWSPKLGTISNYQTVSEGEFSEVRHEFILNTSPLASVAALCNKARLTSPVITKWLGGVWGRPLY